MRLYITAPVEIPLEAEALVKLFLLVVVSSGNLNQGVGWVNPVLLRSTTPCGLSPAVPKPI